MKPTRNMVPYDHRERPGGVTSWCDSCRRYMNHQTWPDATGRKLCRYCCPCKGLGR